jgi:hypothetical protein
MGMNIYIPTYKRDKVVTYQSLPERLRRQTVLVVAEEEAERYHELCPLATIQVVPEQGKGAALVKQAIYDHCHSNNEPACAMLDDDLVFKEAAWEQGRKRFRQARHETLQEAIDKLCAKCLESGTAFTSLSIPFFNRYQETWARNKRMEHSLIINVKACKSIGASFLGIPSVSDVKFCLECYTAGLCSWTLTDLAVVDLSRPGEGGENYDGKRAERFAEAVEYLTARWPRYVTRREVKNNRRHLRSIGCPFDIRFYRGRAYKDALASRR